MRIKRVYSKGTGDVTKTIRLSSEMLAMLDRLADEEGESTNAYIVLALDEHLQMKAEAGELPAAKSNDKRAKK